MSRLRTSGSVRQMDPHSVIARVKAQPVSRLSFQPRATTRANPGPTARSFVSSLPGRDGVCSFDESRKGSRLPIRSLSPTQVPSFTFRRHSIVEERRAARQARPRPWISERSTLPSRLHLSSRNPMPAPKPTIPSYSRLSTRAGNVQTKPETSVKGGRKSKPAKRVHFGETTVVSVTRWINSPVKNVHFGSETVIPVTPWIVKEEHVYRPPSRRRLLSRRNIPTPHAQSTAQVDRVGNVRAKPAALAKGKAKTKPTKTVRFGESSVVSVTRWINRREHTHRPPITAMGHLQGWSVTRLPKPNSDGEEEKYTTYWGSRPYAMFSTHASGPCDRQYCAWNYLASLQARHPEWDRPSVVGLAFVLLQTWWRFSIRGQRTFGRWFPIYRGNDARLYAVFKP
ncbi:hypothetical protein BJX76DRAFT_362274 [Aspergillus varians]